MPPNDPNRDPPGEEAVTRLEALGGPLPAAPTEAVRVLAHLDRAGSPPTVANAGGRYFGCVNGGALPAAVAANMLAAAWDQNAALRVMSPVAARLEEIVLGWLVELLALPEGTGGAFVTGATMANFACLAAWATTEQDVELSLEAMLRTAGR